MALTGSLHGQDNNSNNDESIPGEWDEFDKVKPMHKGADEDDTKNSIDNPENADGDTNGSNSKKDFVDDQFQQEFIQISFKVNC